MTRTPRGAHSAASERALRGLVVALALWPVDDEAAHRADVDSEVADEEIRICGSPGRLLKSIGPPVVGTDTADVRGFVPEWLLGQDSNLRPAG